MARLLTLPAGRRSKFLVAAVFILVSAIVGGLFAGKFEDAQKNETVSFLPGKAESVKSLKAVKRYPGGELAPAVIVYERKGGLTKADRARVVADERSFAAKRPSIALPPGRPVFSPDGRAALFSMPIRATGDSTRFENGMDDIRGRVSGEKGGLTVKVTGAAGYGADAVKVFGNINGTLLGVTALIVLILLVIIYRSPIFWAIPFFTVLLAESAARGFGYLLAEAGGTINGQSGGIPPLLVLGGGTDYALLLVSRYREELRRHDDKHEAMRVALRNAGPAILASGLTVIVALLTLTLAEVNATAGLGPVGAMGVFLAMVSMLTMLPALLVVCGRRAFWSPFLDTIPHVGDPGTDETHGAWRRIGERVARRPRRIWVAGTVVLILLALNVTQIDTGLTNGNSFRGSVESVQGADILARSFPGGLSAPTNVIVPAAARAPAVRAALLKRRDLVATVRPPQQGPPGTRLDVILRRDPFSTAAFEETPQLRRIARAAGGPRVLVGARPRGRPAPRVLRIPQVRAPRQLRDPADRAARRVPHPRPAAARAARPAAADRVGDPLLLRRAGHGDLLLQQRLRFLGRRPIAAAARVRLPRPAGHRLQHLPDGARARGDAAPRHPRGHAARPGGDGRGHHFRGDPAGRDLQRGGPSAARVPDRDRLHHRVRGAAGPLPRALRARPRARLRPGPAD